MGKYHPALEWGLGTIYLALIIWGLWHLGGWLFVEAMNLTPKKLAVASLLLTAIPFAFLIVFGVAGVKNAMHVSGAITVLSFWLSLPGLVAATVWYVVSN